MYTRGIVYKYIHIIIYYVCASVLTGCVSSVGARLRVHVGWRVVCVCDICFSEIWVYMSVYVLYIGAAAVSAMNALISVRKYNIINY